MTGPVSWCGEGLASHQASVAVLAWAAYEPEWLWASRAAGVPGWALTLAAAGHDAGKALPCLQEEALRACEHGATPSFRLHEYASSYALAALASSARGRRMPPGDALGLIVASLAALLHHHGMEGRLADPIGIVRARRDGGARPGRGVRCDHIAVEARRSLGALLDATIESCRLARGLAGRAGVAVEECPAWLEELARQASRNPPLWNRAFEDAFTYLTRAHARARAAALTVAVAAVSVADTISASAARGDLCMRPAREACRRPGRYALRLLCENPSRLEAVAQALEVIAGEPRP